MNLNKPSVLLSPIQLEKKALMSVHSLFPFPNYVFGCVLLIRSVTQDWKRKCSVWAGKSRKLSFYGR